MINVVCIDKWTQNTIENYVILPIISQREIIYSQKLLVTLQFRPDTCRINIETTKQLQLWYFSVKTVCCLVLILTPKGKTDEMIFTLSGYGWCLLHSCILYYTMLISNSHLGFENVQDKTFTHFYRSKTDEFRKC